MIKTNANKNISFTIKRDDWLQNARQEKEKICGREKGFILEDEHSPSQPRIFFKGEQNPVLTGFTYEIMSRLVESPEVELYQNYPQGEQESEDIQTIVTKVYRYGLYNDPKVLVATKGLSRDYTSWTKKSKTFRMLFDFCKDNIDKYGAMPLSLESNKALLKQCKEIFREVGYEKLKKSLTKIALLQHILQLWDLTDCDHDSNLGVSIVTKDNKKYITASAVDFSFCSKPISFEALSKKCNEILLKITGDETIKISKDDLYSALETIKSPFKRKITQEGYYIKDKNSKTSFTEIVEESYKKIIDRITTIGLKDDNVIKAEIIEVNDYRERILKNYEKALVFAKNRKLYSFIKLFILKTFSILIMLGKHSLSFLFFSRAWAILPQLVGVTANPLARMILGYFCTLILVKLAKVITGQNTVDYKSALQITAEIGAILGSVLGLAKKLALAENLLLEAGITMAVYGLSLLANSYWKNSSTIVSFGTATGSIVLGISMAQSWISPGTALALIKPVLSISLGLSSGIGIGVILVWLSLALSRTEIKTVN